MFFDYFWPLTVLGTLGTPRVVTVIQEPSQKRIIHGFCCLHAEGETQLEGKISQEEH